MKKFKHLDETGYTYPQHLKISLGYCFTFAKLSFYSAVHAVYPDIFTTRATEGIKDLYKTISKKN